MPDQGKAVGVMAGTIPADRNPEFIAWMFPLLGDDDRENMTRVWQMVMPAEVLASFPTRPPGGRRRLDGADLAHPETGRRWQSLKQAGKMEAPCPRSPIGISGTT